MSVSRTPAHATPGRRRNANKENVYFEPGKKGRKTGITLRDTGKRDEHGFEPVSGIFSSPNRPSPERAPTLGSASVIAETLQLGRTPRLPPRSPGPRRTHISGSPRRQSAINSASPRRNAHEETPSRSPERSPGRTDGRGHDVVVRSIEREASPSKTGKAFSRELVKTRKSLFDFDLSPERKKKKVASSPIDDAIEDVSQILDLDGPRAPVAKMVADDTTAGAYTSGHDTVTLIDDDGLPEVSDIMDEQTTPSVREHADEPNTKRKRGRPPKRSTLNQRLRHSNGSSVIDANDTPGSIGDDHANSAPTHKPLAPREDQSGVEGDEDNVVHATDNEHVEMNEDADHTVAADKSRSSTKRKRVTMDTSHVGYDLDDGGGLQIDDSPLNASRLYGGRADSSDESVYEAQENGADEPEHDEQEEEGEDSAEQEQTSKSRRRTSVRLPGRPQKRTAPWKRGPQVQKPRRAKSPPPAPDATLKVKIKKVKDTGAQLQVPGATSEEDSDGAPRQGTQRLRSNTPFEDEGVRITRSGRASVKPLAFWKNETFIYRNGEVEGIVRAQEVTPPKPSRKTHGNAGRRQTRLGSIVEAEEEDEELLPEAWEDELQVIKGPVRQWDDEVQAGSVGETYNEDVAFAAGSIKTQTVQGSEFRYAKVMTTPFYGAGLVELPPGGYKKSKNTRKMHMGFFVHEGKVTVEVAGMAFGLTKGGMWQVPRGNNYAITNESTVHSAKVFFSQGCEVDLGAQGEVDVTERATQ